MKIPTVSLSGLVMDVDFVYDCNVVGGVFIKISGRLKLGVITMGVGDSGI